MTVTSEPDQQAEVAWVIGTQFQRRGFAREAAGLMVDWLRDNRIPAIVAHVPPDHQASAQVALSLGMQPTSIIEDGEVRWLG